MTYIEKNIYFHVLIKVRKGKNMKKVWEKPTMDIISCDRKLLRGNIKDMSEEELAETLKNIVDAEKFTANENYILREIAGEAV